MTWNDKLASLAKYHTEDQGPTGEIGHASSNNGSLSDREKMFGMAKTSSGENISYGSPDGEDVVESLFIDDGIPSRGHRDNLMDPNFRQMGSFTGPHTVYNQMTTINYADEFR